MPEREALKRIEEEVGSESAPREHRGRGQGFGRDYRLTQKGDYRQVFADGNRQGSRLFTVLFRRNGLSHPRLGLAIAKKSLKRAVDRNRVKRVIRARFREAIPDLPGMDIVFIARPALAQADKAELHQTVEKLLRRLPCEP